ncbi:hypothetical protein GY45DRAFT_1432563 [Cubamyces sp. BRFM 1775]|nr:hypothetical protein GY45DRAFT_1432563 [Cubamyces sp. BRFM 1775]
MQHLLGGFNRSMSSNLVFQCAELAAEIFNHLAPGPLSQKDTVQYRWLRSDRQRSLARAARVCRLWSVPALDVLWRVVDDVRDLLRVLPCICNDEGFIVLQRDVTPAEWERFQRYADRVCELRWCSPPRDPGPFSADEEDAAVPIPSSVWEAISEWCRREGRSEMCPRLQRVACFPAPTQADTGALILLSPTVCDLSISIQDTLEPIAMSELFSPTHPLFASLQSFAISRGEFDVCGTYLTTAEGTYDLLNLENFAALQHLDIGTTPISVNQDLVALFERWGLRSLTLEIKGIDDDVAALQARPRGGGLHDTLRELHIKGDPALLGRFAECAVGPGLEELGVHFTFDASSDGAALRQVRNVYSRIMERTPSLISSVSVKLSRIGRVIRFSAIDFLRPLLPKAGLRHIAISCGHPYIQLCRGDMLEFAHAWPYLATLRVDWHGVHPDIIRLHAEIHHQDPPLVGDLVSFAEAHPELKYLALPSLSARSMPRIQEVPVLGHGLEVLYVRSIQEPDEGRLDHSQSFHLALLLDRMFPDLVLCRSEFRGMRKWEGRWYTVERALLALQTGRRGTHYYF